METNDRMIQKIKDLYPIDCEYSDTNIIGEALLIEAIKKVGWEKLSSEFLAQYLIECANEEESGEMTEKLRNLNLI